MREAESYCSIAVSPSLGTGLPTQGPPPFANVSTFCRSFAKSGFRQAQPAPSNRPAIPAGIYLFHANVTRIMGSNYAELPGQRFPVHPRASSLWPKKLPELARQLGKLMGEFRRASNEFRMQMDEELRISDQAEQQKKIAAMEAAAPPVIPPGTEVPSGYETSETLDGDAVATEPLPIASEGDLSLMPPDTGLPIARGLESSLESETTATNGASHETEGNAALTPVLETIPHSPDPATRHLEDSTEAPLHG